MRPFTAVSHVSTQPGVRLIVLGAVHGNETCGTRAIERAIGEIETGTLALHAGRVTWVPVANPLAYEKRRRTGDRNLNRNLVPTDTNSIVYSRSPGSVLNIVYLSSRSVRKGVTAVLPKSLGCRHARSLIDPHRP